jgi:hypothetical protein
MADLLLWLALTVAQECLCAAMTKTAIPPAYVVLKYSMLQIKMMTKILPGAPIHAPREIRVTRHIIQAIVV